MLGLNMFAILSFTAINIFAAYLCRCDGEKRKWLLRKICIVLVFFNLCRYTLSPILGFGLKVPVEFSTVSYFAVPIIFLTESKWLRSWAAYSGIMAGFFYYLTMIVAGGSIYADYPPYDTYISLCCHGTLYLCGLVSLKTDRFKSFDCYKLFCGVGLIALNAHLFRPIADNGTRLFIYELMDGIYVRRILPDALQIYLSILNIALVSGFVLLTVNLFFRLNRSQLKKRLCTDQCFVSVQTQIAPLVQ